MANDQPAGNEAVVEPRTSSAPAGARTTFIDDKVKDYIVDLVCATRDPGNKIQLQGPDPGSAPRRATIALTLAAKALRS
jgi:MoxR-like ATPase